MKLPRFRIAWMIAFVAIAALDFGAIRALLGFNSYWAALLLVGALPMANVLAVGILIGQQRPGSGQFLLRFEAFGAMALALYVAFSFVPNERAMTAYLAPFDDLWITIGDLPFVSIPFRYLFAGALCVWPQVAFALLGGFLSRRFKVTITRRTDATTSTLHSDA